MPPALAQAHGRRPDAVPIVSCAQFNQANGTKVRGRPSSPSCCLRGAALEETGKMRPSTPMSPTCTLFGMPPRAMTAQFSNSNGGMGRAGSPLPAADSQREHSGSPRRRARSAAPYHASRTTKPRPARQSGSLSGRPQTSRRRLAMTRQAVGEISMPIHWRFNFCAATSAVPQPQN